MKIKEGHIPMYFQLYLRFKNEILLSEIAPSEMIPPLDRITEIYGVSHTTARKAMEILDKEGLIMRKRGQGTIVKENIGPFIYSPQPIEEEMKTIEEEYTFETLSDGWIDPPRRILPIFSGKRDAFWKGKIYRIERLVVNKEEARKRRLSEVFLPAWLVNQTSFEQIRKHPTIKIVSSLDISAVTVFETILPWMTDTYLTEILQTTEGTPIFHFSRRYVDSDGMTLWYVESKTTFNAISRKTDIDMSQFK